MRNGPLLLAATTLGLAGVVLLTVVWFGAPAGPGGNASVLLGNNVRYMQARALVGQPSMLQQQQKAAAMDSLEGAIRQGLFKNVFASPKNTNQLCEGRGCTFDNPAIVPEQVAFECGGMKEAKMCLGNVQTCVDSSEDIIKKYYTEDKRRAREARPAHLCKCFVSNGCEPACNVAMYMVWSTGSGLSCPAHPPKYMASARAFQYGDPMSTNVEPTDISYDYFPEYPSPAGRHLSVEDMRRLYHSDDLTPQTLPPAHPWHWGRYDYPAAETYYHPFNYYSPFYSSTYRPYTYEQPDYPQYYPYYNPSANYYYPYSSYDPYYWANYYKGYDSAGYGADDTYATYDSSEPASEWERFGDYYYDSSTGQVVMTQ